jgi:hypothetical protein
LASGEISVTIFLFLKLRLVPPSDKDKILCPSAAQTHYLSCTSAVTALAVSSCSGVW